MVVIKNVILIQVFSLILTTRKRFKFENLEGKYLLTLENSIKHLTAVMLQVRKEQHLLLTIGRNSQDLLKILIMLQPKNKQELSYLVMQGVVDSNINRKLNKNMIKNTLVKTDNSKIFQGNQMHMRSIKNLILYMVKMIIKNIKKQMDFQMILINIRMNIKTKSKILMIIVTKMMIIDTKY